MDKHPETTLRLNRFRQLADERGQVLGVPASELNAQVDGLRVFYGGRGIWRDLARTNEIAEAGVTVGLLHTGRHYSDDLLADGIVYHYPTTESRTTDSNEVEATKNAGSLGIPVFVVVQRGQLRDVHLGLIEDFDDNDKTFLVGFVSPDETMVGESPRWGVSPDEEPFVAFDKKPKKRSEVNSRERDPKFAFKVRKRSGSACAVCGIDVKGLIDAAHVIPVSEGGSNHPANGLPLCPTHHRAFDAGLFWINPLTLAIRTHPHPSRFDLGLLHSDIAWLPARPNPEALRWHAENVVKTTNDRSEAATDERLVAIHEAGHAVAAALLSLEIDYVSAVPSDDYLGIVKLATPPVEDLADPAEWDDIHPDGVLGMKEDLSKRIMQFQAGDVAVEMLLPYSQPIGIDHDEETAALLGDALTEGSGEQNRAFLGWLRVKVKELLERPDNRDSIIAVADALEREGRLDNDQVLDFVGLGKSSVVEWQNRMKKNTLQ